MTIFLIVKLHCNLSCLLTSTMNWVSWRCWQKANNRKQSVNNLDVFYSHRVILGQWAGWSQGEPILLVWLWGSKTKHLSTWQGTWNHWGRSRDTEGPERYTRKALISHYRDQTSHYGCAGEGWNEGPGTLEGYWPKSKESNWSWICLKVLWFFHISVYFLCCLRIKCECV